MNVKYSNMKRDEEMILKCTNKKCEYEWNYKGKSTFYTSCPRCRANVKIKEAKK